LEFLGKNARILIMLGSSFLFLGVVFVLMTLARRKDRKKNETRRPSFF
jgi:hypothetical protein